MHSITSLCTFPQKSTFCKKLFYYDRNDFDVCKCSKRLHTEIGIRFSWLGGGMLGSAVQSFLEMKFLSQLHCSHQEVDFECFWSEFFCSYHADSFSIKYFNYWSNILKC